ncbi:GNAT family N-acetyltransferase [Geodermatophilus sp. YIM 151500]|uniref:GNAT family N-acetyltransferase n=1 Tax=Geodermatophilus sp. YIM 151500 TaxID=2984531 RepID=UPI0021E3820C|nr:GNAT family protein [Geodermatophilus sp. YIM 151500]MCV2488528.1 GNAT family N-acetyltransferase [Geodermatophilus sp. YIM 151500]
MIRDGRLGTDQPTLDGPRVRLRPWRPDDADAVLAACQDAEIQRWTRVPVPYRRADADEFVTAIAPATWAEGGAQFAVVLRAGGALVGSIALFPPRDGVAECGYYTLAGSRGRGLAAEALRVLAGWAFDDRGLRRLELRVHPRNTASRRVGAAAGFVVEGTLRQRSLHRGQPVDDVVLGLLATDPRPAPDRPAASVPPGASSGTSADRVT